MLILKISVVIAGWLFGFISLKKHRQVFLTIPALITMAVLFIDSSHINELGNTVNSLNDSYMPIEKTSLESYPDLPKEKAIRKYLEDLNKIKIDNEQLQNENVNSVRKIEILEQENTDNKKKLLTLNLITSEHEKKQSIIQEFTEVSSWNFGGGIDLGGGVGVAGPPSGLLNKHISHKDGKTFWECDSEAVNDYREIIKQYPKYPFPYLYIGMCLKGEQDHTWKTYATKGQELFMKTTSLPKHNPSHDDGFRFLNDVLKE